MDKLKYFHAQNIYTHIILFVILFFVLIVFLQVDLVNLSIRNDNFRHLAKIVIPVFFENGHVSLLWSNHHPSPFLHIFQYLNIILFNFDMRLDFILGVLASIGTALILCLQLFKHSSFRKDKIYLVVILVMFPALIIINKINSIYVVWPLVTFQNVFLFAGVLYSWIILSTPLLSSKDKKTLAQNSFSILTVLTATLALLLVHGTVGIFFGLATAITLLILACTTRQTLYAIAGFTIFIFLVTYNQLTSSDSSLTANLPSGSEIFWQVRHILIYIEEFGKQMLQSTQILSKITKLDYVGAFCFFTGAVALLVMIMSLVRLPNYAHLFTVAIALIGMLLASAVIRGSGAAAAEDGSWTAIFSAPRYDHYFSILTATIIILGILLFRVFDRPGLKRLLTKVFAVAITYIVLAQLSIAYRNSDFLLNIANQYELTTYMSVEDSHNSFDLRPVPAGYNGQAITEKTLKFLKSNGLNVFDVNKTFHPHLENYRLASSIFNSGMDKIHQIEVSADPNCFQLTEGDHRFAWSATVQSSALGNNSVTILDSNGETIEMYKPAIGKSRLMGISKAGNGFEFCGSPSSNIAKLEIVRY